MDREHVVTFARIFFFVSISHLPQASSEYTDEQVDLEVYLINGKKVTLKVSPSDRTDEMLEVRQHVCVCVCSDQCAYVHFS